MRKFAIALTGAVVALAMPPAASAQSFSSFVPVSGEGQIWISQSLAVTCNFSFMGTVISSSTVQIYSRNMGPGGDFECLLMAPVANWSAQTVSGDATKIDMTMGFNTITNQPCYGTVRGDWDNAGKMLTVFGGLLPPINPSHQWCNIRSMDIYIPDLDLS